MKWIRENYKGEKVVWYSADVIEKIKSYINDYKEQCKVNCIDARMCSTCFLGGANELGEELLDVIENEVK